VPCTALTAEGRLNALEEAAMTGRKSALALGLWLVAYPALAQDHARSRSEGSGGNPSPAAERHADPAPAPAPAPTAASFSFSNTGASEASAQDHAQSRGGGSSGSSAGSSHPSSSSSGSSHSSGSGSSGSSESGSAITGAQARHPRPGTGSAYYPRGGSYVYGSPYYYSPFGYYPYDLYYGFYGYSPYYYSGFYGYSQGYYNRYRYGSVGSLRLLVEPPETAVYVDGYYAGTVDDFDGLFQRLHVSPGRHDLTLRLDGYQTQRLKVYVPVEETLKIHHKMVRGTGDAPELAIGVPDPRADRYAERDREREEEDLGREADEARRDDRAQLRVEVRPQDASIYVDGEFRGTARRVLSLSLPPGRHRVEIVRPGYRTFEREVDLRPGRTEDVTVDLER
jgi:PEGA domain-containing protein